VTFMVGVLLALLPGMLVGGGLGVLFGVMATPRCRHPVVCAPAPVSAPAPVRVAADRVPAPAPVVVNVVIPGLPQPAPVMWPNVVEGQVMNELPQGEWRSSGGW
jgi:hypothetical protein